MSQCQSVSKLERENITRQETHQVADVVLQRCALRVDLLQSQLEPLHKSCVWQCNIETL